MIIIIKGINVLLISFILRWSYLFSLTQLLFTHLLIITVVRFGSLSLIKQIGKPQEIIIFREKRKRKEKFTFYSFFPLSFLSG